MARPKKYAEKIKLTPLKFEEATKALIETKPPKSEKNKDDSKAI